MHIKYYIYTKVFIGLILRKAIIALIVFIKPLFNQIKQSEF